MTWGLRFASTKRYTKEHEWVEYDPESSAQIGTIGITEYAQKSLGDLVYVELPVQGATVAAGDQIGAIESVKAASDIFAPISGTVEEVNTDLDQDGAKGPGTVNKDAEGEGWLAKIKLTNPQELEELLSDESYKAFCEGQDAEEH